MPEERNGILSFSKTAIFKPSSILQYKLPKFTASSLAEIQKKAGIFCQIVCQMAFGILSRWLFIFCFTALNDLLAWRVINQAKTDTVQGLRFYQNKPEQTFRTAETNVLR